MPGDDMKAAPCARCDGSGVEPNLVTEGIRVKAIRVARGLSLRQVGDAVGCSGQYVHLLERGHYHWSGRMARKVRAFLGA